MQQQHSGYSDASPPSTQCGMCGGCGSMPPWAPEALAKATAAERQALKNRMEEARERFIAARDARLAHQKSLARKDDSQPTTADKDEDPNLGGEDQIQSLPETSEKVRKSILNGDELAITLRRALNEDTSSSPRPQQQNQQQLQQLQQQKQQLWQQQQQQLLQQQQQQLQQMQQMQQQQQQQLQKQQLWQPQQPQPLEQKAQHQSSMPDIAKSQDFSKKVTADLLKQRTSVSTPSLTDFDSDADSFHTAEDEDHTVRLDPDEATDPNNVQQSPANIYIPQESSAEPNDEIDLSSTTSTRLDTVEQRNASNSFAALSDSSKPISEPSNINNNLESEWAPFQTETQSQTATAAIVHPSITETKISSSIDSTRTDTRDVSNDDLGITIEMKDLSPKSTEENVETWTSDNLEQILLAQSSIQTRQRKLVASTFSATSDDTANNNILESHVEPPVLTSPRSQDNDAVYVQRDIVQCVDCQAWRDRVIQLESKLETLSSSLAIREMEVATLKSQIDDSGKYVPRSEARLIEECESLRVTTEFLFQKLERYERSLQGRQGDVH